MPQLKRRAGIIKLREVPTIACINKATIDLKVDFDKLIRVLQKFLDHCFVPAWGTPAKLVKATRPLAGAWTLAFFDDADHAWPFLDKVGGGPSLGRHRLAKNGLPLAMIFVRPTLELGEKLSLVASHELAEMLVDPAVNLWSTGPKGMLYAYEVSDVVEQNEFNIDGIAVSNFVYPAYFEAFRKPRSAQFDHLKKLDRPFQIPPSGYSQIRKGQKVRHQFGSERKKEHFKNEDRRLHRSEFRKAIQQHLSRTERSTRLTTNVSGKRSKNRG
jgi:hypothetical protein